MRTTHTLVATLVALAAIAAPASAADGVWTGAHLGVDLGQGQATTSITDVEYDNFGSTMTLTDYGMIMGLRGGYDQQIGALVVGADLTWQYTGCESKEVYDGNIDISNSADWVAALRVRGGLAVDNSLLYIVAGLAKGEFSHSYVERGASADSIQSFENDHIGSVLGFGLETLLGKIALRGEVVRYDIPDASKETPNGNTYKFADELVAFTLGASYRF